MFAAVACNPDESIAPATDPVAAAPVETPAATSAAPTADLATASLTAPGIPFGDFHLPTSMYRAPYSGALYATSVSAVISNLNTAKSAGMRIVISLVGNRSNYTNSNGTFNLTKWKSRIDMYRKVNLAPFVSSGTIIGHYMVDEPYCAACWGGRQIPVSDIEAMARYSKSIWPSIPTGVRSSPSQLGSSHFTYLDFAWAQYVGPLHYPSFGQSAAAISRYAGGGGQAARPRARVRDELPRRWKWQQPHQWDLRQGPEPQRQRPLRERWMLPLRDVGERGEGLRHGVRTVLLRLRRDQLEVQRDLPEPVGDEGRDVGRWLGRAEPQSYCL